MSNQLTARQLAILLTTYLIRIYIALRHKAPTESLYGKAYEKTRSMSFFLKIRDFLRTLFGEMQFKMHPIVADDMYSGSVVYPWQLADAEPAVQQPVIDRAALHAHMLEFRHPKTDKMVKFEAPLPEDMQNLLDLLRRHRKS